MLSTAAAALLAGQAFADTTIDKSTSTALTTGTLETITSTTTSTGTTTASGTGNAGNITITSAGSVGVGLTNQGAITVNSDSFVSNAGVISNKNQSTSTGILVDMTTNPDPIISTNTANASNPTLIGIDNVGTIDMTGSGTGKHGIWLNGIGTFTGPITLEANSTMSIEGDQSQAITMDSGSVLTGNLTMGGAITLDQTTANSTTASSLIGADLLGTVNGNVALPSGGTLTVTGDGGEGMVIGGGGIVGGNLVIGGTIGTTGLSTTTETQSVITNPNTIYPEGGLGLGIGASVANGVAILGPGFSGDTSAAAASVTVQGLSPAVQIDPGLNSAPLNGTAVPLVIGVYTTDGTTAADTNDPGFSVYNRGTITAAPVNANNNVTAMVIQGGGSTADSTTLTGGLFNSGSLTASAVTTGTSASGNTVTALSIENYVTLGVSSTGFTKNPAAGSSPGDQAAFVNSAFAGSGSISASASGTRGGVATAIEIGTGSSVPSLINSGTISASVSISDNTQTGEIATGVNPSTAEAIIDQSGSLTSIVNSGTISATATTLDNNKQVTVAINLTGNTLPLGTSPGSPSAYGVSIVDQSLSNVGAKIVGDIDFGSGNNQSLTIIGSGLNSLATVQGNVNFGSDTGGATSGDQLTIGSYGALDGLVTAPSSVSVDVKNLGSFSLQGNGTQSTQQCLGSTGACALSVYDMHIESGGTLSLGVTEAAAATGVVTAKNSVTLDSGANLGIAYASFVPQETSGHPDQFVLITAPNGKLSVADLSIYNTAVSTPNTQSGGAMPFLFQSANLQCIGSGPGCTGSTGTAYDELVLNVVPKTLGPGANQLNLVPGSYGYQLFDNINNALGIDDELGAAMINGIRNTQQAQAAYDSFAPNVTGGSRAIAVSITDQATGVVGDRLRLLNMFSKDPGEETLWGQEFFQMIKDPGQGAVQADGARLLSGFKDHGFGFALGMDGGTPRFGWYGGAFTFYAGDVGEIYNASNNSGRDSHTNEQWYVLSGYSVWRGKGLFFDSKIDVGYGHFDGKRYINLDIPAASAGTSPTLFTREADNKHAGALLSGGFTTGAMLNYGATTLMPQLSVDGLLMREEGYTEYNPGTTPTCANTTNICDGFDLQVQPYYARSLRAFLGSSVRHDFDLGDFFLQPELRLGYRYDFLSDPVKLKAAFAYANVTGATPTAGQQFSVEGPDPAKGNFVLGGTLAATTDAWTFGGSFDYLRGTNGEIEEVGMLNLLGRI
jgi:hypothetical protein